MIIIGTIALILVAVGSYLFGVYQQSRDEVIADGERKPDIEMLEEARWEISGNPANLAFVQQARMLDPTNETVHNLRLSQVIHSTGEGSKKNHIQSDRITVDAVKLNRQTGAITRAIISYENPYRDVAVSLLRRAGIKTSITENTV